MPADPIDWEQRAKDAEAALWCIIQHDWNEEDHAHMTCDCRHQAQAATERIDEVLEGVDHAHQ